MENIIMNEFLDDSDEFDDVFLWESSSSSSESDNTDNTRRVEIKNKLFVENCIIHYDAKEFQEHFRMFRTTANKIIAIITEKDVFSSHNFGRAKCSVEKGFLLSVWYLSNTETFRQVSNRFGVSKSTAHKCVNIVVNCLLSMSLEFIKMNTIYRPSKNFAKLPGTIGAIDGTHIKINKPYKDQEVYINRKGYHSIILQAVCDENKIFTDICCGEPGSLNDARVLKRSQLYANITTNELVLNNNFILGDSAYPSLRWLIPPYKDNGHLTDRQKAFNYMHSSVRVVIENAFGLLKNRYRRLKFFENFDIEFIKKCVIAACLLHNICITCDDLQIEIVDNPIPNVDNFNIEDAEFDILEDRREELVNMVI